MKRRDEDIEKQLSEVERRDERWGGGRRAGVRCEIHSAGPSHSAGPPKVTGPSSNRPRRFPLPSTASGDVDRVQVGQALGRLDPLARQIGQTAERHRLRAEVTRVGYGSDGLEGARGWMGPCAEGVDRCLGGFRGGWGVLVGEFWLGV